MISKLRSRFVYCVYFLVYTVAWRVNYIVEAWPIISYFLNTKYVFVCVFQHTYTCVYYCIVNESLSFHTQCILWREWYMFWQSCISVNIWLYASSYFSLLYRPHRDQGGLLNQFAVGLRQKKVGSEGTWWGNELIFLHEQLLHLTPLLTLTSWECHGVLLWTSHIQRP